MTAAADALPRPHCRRCDTQLVNELQLRDGLCDPHITEYEAMRAVFLHRSAEPSLAVDHSRTETASSGFDAKHAVAFLDQVFGDVYSGRFSISRLTPSGGMRSEHFQWPRYAVAKAEEWDALRPPGIYFRATALLPNFNRKGRGGEDDAHAVPFLWADLDYGTVGHKAPAGAVLPPDEEAARKIIADLPTPSILIHSGGGLYPIWQFKQPVFITDTNRAEVKTRSQDWQNLIKAKAEQLGWHYGSGVGDLARVLRLPGSINRKEGLERPCRVIEESGEVLTW